MPCRNDDEKGPKKGMGRDGMLGMVVIVVVVRWRVCVERCVLDVDREVEMG